MRSYQKRYDETLFFNIAQSTVQCISFPTGHDDVRTDQPRCLSFVAAKRWTLIDDYDLCWSREADRRECRLVVAQPKHAYVTVVVSRNDHDATWKSPRIRQFLYHIMSLVIDTLQHGRPFFRRCHQS